jgi:hypothetical protein
MSRTLLDPAARPADNQRVHDADGKRVLSLRAAARVFFRAPTPPLLAPILAAAATARIVVARWSPADVVVVGVLLALQPFTEWLIHVFVLHFRPRTLGRVRIDLHAARKHRAHHLAPNDIDTAFVPLLDLVGLVGISFAMLAIATRSLPLFLTGAVTSLTLLTLYEWTHFLVHTAYRPRRAYYRSLWRAHRLHHFKNEHYWFGVTVHLADRVFGTFPEKSAVETSATARTLAIDVT